MPAGVRRAETCSGGVRQDGNSGYSPPCYAFTGDNGGATARGVSAEEILVAFRDAGNPLQGGGGGTGTTELEKSAGTTGVLPSADAYRRTRDAMLEYFNRTFQLYGRKVRLVDFKGRGNVINEFSGRGQETANADALKVEQEIKAFADLSAATSVYFDALVRHDVVTFSQGFHLPPEAYRSPYAWGAQVDCATLLRSAADLLAKRLPPGGSADRAGSAALRAKPRRYGLLLPDDPVYGRCVDATRAAFKAAGIEIAKEVRYAPDIAQMQLQPPNIVGQLKVAGVTTVVVLTGDGAFPLFLTPAATQQDFWPEWFVTGSSLTDTDPAGQLYDQRQWQNALGQSYLGEFRDGKTSESWRAYRAVRPGDEPILTRDLDYYPMLMLFIGLQMAGPNLTPQTFQQGMYAYGAHAGDAGTWSFGARDHTASDDAREIYYDPKAVSPFNNRPGRYVSTGERRYRETGWPPGRPAAPVPPPAAAYLSRDVDSAGRRA